MNQQINLPAGIVMLQCSVAKNVKNAPDHINFG